VWCAILARVPITADSRGLGERKVVVWIARAVGYLVYAYLIVVEAILLLGFVLLLFGANPSAGFTQWAYRNLDRVMSPFRGIFTPIELGTTSGDVQTIVDTSVLFAMIIYGIIAIAFSALISWLTNRLQQIREAEEEQQRRAELEAQAAAASAAVTAASDAQAAPTGSTPPPGAIPPS
jgi:hypothetical protein